MATFVLVHGAWHGGWCWARTAPLLRQAGHETHCVTLTGVGERAHLLSADIRLDTHILDVIGLLRCEEVSDVVLVGHSYAGIVITGVADRLLQGAEAPLRHLVYLDAVAPHPGESWSTLHDPKTVETRLEQARRHGGLAIPPPDPAIFGLEGADHAWVERRQTPQPLGVYRDPLHFDPARLERVARTFIDCTNPALATIDPMRRRVREEAGWHVIELESGHDPMVSAPEALSAILLACAAS